jgi:hypothetical protein
LIYYYTSPFDLINITVSMRVSAPPHFLKSRSRSQSLVRTSSILNKRDSRERDLIRRRILDVSQRPDITSSATIRGSFAGVLDTAVNAGLVSARELDVVAIPAPVADVALDSVVLGAVGAALAVALVVLASDWAGWDWRR